LTPGPSPRDLVPPPRQRRFLFAHRAVMLQVSTSGAIPVPGPVARELASPRTLRAPVPQAGAELSARPRSAAGRLQRPRPPLERVTADSRAGGSSFPTE